MPSLINGDALRLRQVLLNLIGNAIKFTLHGEVVVTVHMEPTSGLEPVASMLHFAIRDTGIGIAPGARDKLFHAFEQADSSTTRQFGGTGLGLAISRRIVTLMGGGIWLESAEGVGSVFHFTVKFNKVVPVPAAPSGVADAEDLRGLPVLIIDDNASNRTILRRIAERWLMLPEEAASGADGLRKNGGGLGVRHAVPSGSARSKDARDGRLRSDPQGASGNKAEGCGHHDAHVR